MRAALEQMIKRANYVALVWKECGTPCPDIPLPTSHGWVKDGNRLQAVPATLLPASKAVLELIKCGWKGSCITMSCSCKNHTLKCTDMCGCFATKCENRNVEEDSTLKVKTVMGTIFFLDCSFVCWDRGKNLFQIEIIPLSLAGDTLICFSRIRLSHNLQSLTKVLGTVLQYSYFLSLLSFLLKQCIIFEIFLQFSLAPPYTKLKLGKILDTRVQHCLWGEGRGWTCVNWNTPQKRRSVPRLLSMIVWKRGGKKKGSLEGFSSP